MHSDAFSPTFEGRLTDGNSAASHFVDVRIGRYGLEIIARGSHGAGAGGDAGAPLVWPYGALSTAQPLGPHAIDALVSYAHQPGATLFVPSGVFARRLAEVAPHLTAGATRWRHARPWILTAALIASLIVLAALLELSPARAIARLLPDKLRLSLGEQTVAAMTDGRKVCEAPAGRAALDTMTQRLSEAAGIDRPFSVVVADWGLVNAFAAPGERIVLTRGLINQAGDPDEVAGVLAHEMGHGIELHPETSLVRAIGLSAAMELMLGGGGGTLGNIGLLVVQIGYTRGAEQEADTQALKLLERARISPKGLAAFFRRMLKREQPDGKSASFTVPDVLSTHPPSEERARRMERAPSYPSTPSLSAAEWKALKGICGTGAVSAE